MSSPIGKQTTAARGGVVRQARGGSSRRGFYLALLLVAVVGVGAIAWAMQRNRATAPIVVPQAAVGGARPTGYVLGSPTAPVEIVEFADFECPSCMQFATVTEPDVRKRLVETGQARYRLYDMQVIQQHRNSPAASLAAACANEQGKFWPMHDLLFEHQNDWSTEATDDPRPLFEGYARSLGLDMTQWGQCYDARRGLAHLAVNRAEADRVQIRGTPTFIIGDRMLTVTPTFDAIKAYVDSARMRSGGAAAAPTAAR